MSSQFSASTAADLTAAFLKDPTGTFVFDESAEHILLGAEEAEDTGGAERSRTQRQRLELNNRIHGIRNEFTFFDDGTLRIREFRWGKPRRETVISLCYLDPRPSLARRVATRTVLGALGSMGLAALMGLAAHASMLVVLTLPAMLISGAAAALLFSIAAYRTYEQISFQTRYGKVVVLTLRANLGCFVACRTLVPKMVAAIDDSRKLNAPDKNRQLREEMREHYRLREVGVLTRAACETGTRRILAGFV